MSRCRSVRKAIARAIRIDQPTAIRQLGKRLNNCLRGFTDAEVDGTKHIYHWRSTDAEAVCEVARVGKPLRQAFLGAVSRVTVLCKPERSTEMCLGTVT